MRAAPKVLVVDDDPSQRAAVRAHLEAANLSVLEAQDAAGALAAAESGSPDLVIMDVQMPGFGSGLDALRALKGHAQLRAVPVIILTGMEPSRMGKADLSGTPVFRKPPDWPALLAAVAAALKPR